jgi:hypothetical protein
MPCMGRPVYHFIVEREGRLYKGREEKKRKRRKKKIKS